MRTMDNFIIPKNPNHFSLEERHVLIQDYLSSGYSKSYIWYKYTGQEDHGRMLKWMRQLGYETQPPEFRHRFVRTTQQIMAERQQNLPAQEDASFELLQLRKRVEELEKELKDAQMKAIAFSTMVDLAEKELKISIRKKLNTKP